MRMMAIGAIQSHWFAVDLQHVRLLFKAGALHQSYRGEARQGWVVGFDFSAHFVRAAMAFATAVDGFLGCQIFETFDSGCKPKIHFLNMPRCVPMASGAANARLNFVKKNVTLFNGQMCAMAAKAIDSLGGSSRNSKAQNSVGYVEFFHAKGDT